MKIVINQLRILLKKWFRFLEGYSIQTSPSCHPGYLPFSFSWRFYPKRLTIAIYFRSRTPLKLLGL